MNRQLPDKHILLFDGYCILCNGYVDWILRVDKKDAIYFSAQQLGQGQELIKQYNIPADLSTIALLTPKGKVLLYSDVPLEIMKVLGGWYQLLYCLKIIPRPIRDFVYKWVAKNRYKWFGKKTEAEACMLPDISIRYKFLM